MGLRPSPRWGSAPNPAGAPPQTPAGGRSPQTPSLSAEGATPPGPGTGYITGYIQALFAAFGGYLPGPLVTVPVSFTVPVCHSCQKETGTPAWMTPYFLQLVRFCITVSYHQYMFDVTNTSFLRVVGNGSQIRCKYRRNNHPCMVAFDWPVLPCSKCRVPSSSAFGPSWRG